MKKFIPILECAAVERETNHTYRQREQNALLWCMVITAITMVLEFVGGLVTHSLALLSDSAHMFSHLFSLGVSAIAILFASKEADAVRSYGFYRAEILAALFNGFTLLIIVIWIVADAIRRFLHPTAIDTLPMLFIAVIGLVVNLITAMILKNVSGHDLNVKSAFFHLLSDTLSSVGIIIAGIFIFYTGKIWLDPLASILIALMIFRWSFHLMHDSIHILLESTPKHLSVKTIVTTLKQEIPKLHQIDHIHIWELTSKVCAFTAHVQIEDIKVSETEDLRSLINHVLQEHFHITHTNLQFECKKGFTR